MKTYLDGNAVVYCEGAYRTTNGKTAHGLVRRTHRYHVLSVVDSTCAGRDAGELLDGRRREIPILPDLDSALEAAASGGISATHLVIGLAPDGGRMTPNVREAIVSAIERGLHVDSGLHDFISEDAELRYRAFQNDVALRDVRKPPPKDMLHFFSGAIEEVSSLVIAILGTDSAVGKRTTAWILAEFLEAAGLTAEMVGTGQTAWLQGARFGLVMDSLPNDFVAGEIEHAVWSAYDTSRPDVILVEGQGSLMHPAYPGGFEILAAARPRAVILQHAPGRREYDGFPGYAIHPLERQIQAIELVSSAKVVAITINTENLAADEVAGICGDISSRTGLPSFDIVKEGASGLVRVLQERFPDLAEPSSNRRLATVR